MFWRELESVRVWELGVVVGQVCMVGVVVVVVVGLSGRGGEL